MNVSNYTNNLEREKLNTRTFRISIFCVALLFLSFKQDDKALPTNFHEVSSDIFRSGQPNSSEMRTLEQLGFKTIINLRYRINDKSEIKGTGLKEIRIPMKAQSITIEEMVLTLRHIKNAKKPVLVHCLHGSDRTGCAIACCRIVFENWKKEDAIAEFLEEKYGYNSAWFPNILDFLESLDENELRVAVLSN